MAQVDRRLTKVNVFDRIIRVNEPGWKPGASQPTPLKQNLIPRFNNKIRANQTNKTRVTKGKTYSLTLLDIENSNGTKDIWWSPHCLNAVHEEAGDECVHEKLRADKFRLRCRDTSPQASSEATRSTPGVEPCSVAPAWFLLLIFFRASSGGCRRRRGTTRSVQNRAHDRDGLVSGWPKAHRRENKEQWWCRAWKEMRLGNGNTAGGLPFYTSTECNDHPKPTGVGTAERSGGGNTGLDNGRPVRSRRHDRGRGKRDGRATLRRRTIVALKRMWSNGLKNWPCWWDRNKEDLAKDFIDPSFACFMILGIWRVWSTDHGLISKGGLSCLDFSRTLIAHEILLLPLQLSRLIWFDAKRALGLGGKNQVEKVIIKIHFYEERED
jgi:hypothetical protein